MFANLMKAAVGIVTLPVDVVVDVVKLPSDAHDGTEFSNTSKKAGNIMKALHHAADPDRD